VRERWGRGEGEVSKRRDNKSWGNECDDTEIWGKVECGGKGLEGSEGWDTRCQRDREDGCMLHTRADEEKNNIQCLLHPTRIGWDRERKGEKEKVCTYLTTGKKKDQSFQRDSRFRCDFFDLRFVSSCIFFFFLFLIKLFTCWGWVFDFIYYLYMLFWSYYWYNITTFEDIRARFLSSSTAIADWISVVCQSILVLLRNKSFGLRNISHKSFVSSVKKKCIKHWKGISAPKLACHWGILKRRK
jgi:hypothetical protein